MSINNKYRVSLFAIEELVIPVMFPRTTALSTRSSKDKLSVACKLYTPKDHKFDINSPSMFFVNGNGFPKVCYG